MAAVDEDTRARLAEDGVVASLLLMHGLYPVPLEQRVQRGARERAAVHGVPRRQRRAALGAGRGRHDPPGRPLLGLRRVLVDARAGDPPGARGLRAGPAGPGGHRRALRAHARAAAGGDPAADGGNARPGGGVPRRGTSRSCGPGRSVRARGRGGLRAVRAADLRRAQAPDPPRRAPDRVHVRDLLVAALGRRGVPAGRQPPRLARGAADHRRAVGGVRDPDRAGLLHDQLGHGQRDRALPEPGRRDGVRARPGRVGERLRRQPGAASSSPTRRR